MVTESWYRTFLIVAGKYIEHILTIRGKTKTIINKTILKKDPETKWSNDLTIRNYFLSESWYRTFLIVAGKYNEHILTIRGEAKTIINKTLLKKDPDTDWSNDLTIRNPFYEARISNKVVKCSWRLHQQNFF